MPRKEKSTHALFLRWGGLEFGAFGIPAIIALVVVMFILGRWRGIL
jgi:hypothetical protein